MSSQKRPVQQSTYSLNGQPRRHPPPGGINESGPSSRAICERRRERGDLNAAALRSSHEKGGCGHLLPLFCPGSRPRSGSSSFSGGCVADFASVRSWVSVSEEGQRKSWRKANDWICKTGEQGNGELPR